MVQDQKKPKTLGPGTSGEKSPLELKDVREQVPEVEDLLSEIDQLLEKTKPCNCCGCG